MQTILFVENDDAFRYSATRHLEHAGYNVIAVANTMAGLRALDAEQAIDLLLLDMHMPAGNPHGPAFARMARVRHPRLPIMYVTGYPDLVGIEELLGKVLVKPLELSTLTDEIRARLAVAS